MNNDVRVPASAARYFLSTETPVQLEAVPGAPVERWMQIPHTRIVRPAYVLLAGETLNLSSIGPITGHSEIYLRFSAAHPDLSSDGATLEVRLLHGEATLPLAHYLVPAGPAGMSPRAARIELHPFAGRSISLQLYCGPGPGSDPTGDWIALFDLVVSSAGHIDHTRARAFHTERCANDVGHFAETYRHAIYARADSNSPGGRREGINSAQQLEELVADHAQEHHAPIRATRSLPAPHELTPVPETAYHYAEQLLRLQLSQAPLNFQARLAELGIPQPRILSLACGEARVESSMDEFARTKDIQPEWALLDLNENLLREAATRFGDRPLQLVTGDINRISNFGQKFDVIMCVSALHHVVELERVLDFISGSLTPGGEFWSIGEAVGRNGNRLWEDEYLAANALFSALPERYRRNAGTGSLDIDLPDVDCSDAAFEGIRSEEILPLLMTRMDPVKTYLYNCFLWRLTNQAYAGNYSLDQAADVALLQDAVRAELAHFAAGGRPASLHGVFRPRARVIDCPG